MWAGTKLLNAMFWVKKEGKWADFWAKCCKTYNIFIQVKTGVICKNYNRKKHIRIEILKFLCYAERVERLTPKRKIK